MSHVLSSSSPPMLFRPTMDRSMSYQSGRGPRSMPAYSIDSNLSNAALPRVPRSTSKARIHNFASPTPSPPARVEVVVRPPVEKPQFSLNGLVFSPTSPTPDTRNVKSGSNTLPRPKKSRGYVFPLGRDEEDESSEHSGAEKAPPAPLPTPTPAPAPALTHKAYTPGKGNALRLNLESIRRTVSEIRVPTTSIASTSAIPLSSSAFVRKKSGELVRPSLKSHSNLTIMTSSPGGTPKPSKSCPTTPTAKNVHFDAQLEHVKLFLAEQKPLAVSRDGSPTETSEGEEFPFPYASSDDEKIRKVLSIKLIGFPTGDRPKEENVQLESLTLSDDARSLNGIVLVRNLAYNKWIAARFTLDSWQTTSEVMARHLESVRGGLYDRFIFTVKLVDVLPRIAEKTMEVAIRYSIEGAEMWDNNGGKNYQVQFSKNRRAAPVAAATKSENSTKSASTSGTNAGDQIAALRRELEKVVKDDSESDSAASVLLRVGKRSGSASSPTAREFGSQAQASSTSTSSGRSATLQPPKRSSPQSDSPPPSPLRSPEPLSARYDFRASLKNTWVPPPLPVVPSPATQAHPPAPRRAMSAFASTSPSRSPPNTLAFDVNTLRPAPLPRGSPRDRDAGSDSELVPEGSAGRKSWAPVGGRNHRRTSYFDQWVTLTPNVRKTPPGSPTKHADGQAQAASPTSSNETVTAGAISVLVPEICATAASPERRDPVTGWGLGLHSPNWSTTESTPSVTSSSGSPASPPTGLGELEPFVVLDSAPKGADSEGFSYHSFLDRFCFYTGPGAIPPPAAAPGAPEQGRLDPRRTHSASSVEAYFLTHDHTRMASNTTEYGSGHSTPTNKTTLGRAESPAGGVLAQ